MFWKFENPSTNGWENAQNVEKMAKIGQKVKKIGLTTHVWAAVEAKPFGLEKIRKQFGKCMDL